MAKHQNNGKPYGRTEARSVGGFVYFLECYGPTVKDPQGQFPMIYTGATNRTITQRVMEHQAKTERFTRRFTRMDFIKALSIAGGTPFAVEHYLKKHRYVIWPLLNNLGGKAVEKFWLWLSNHKIAATWVDQDGKPTD